jgi:MFS transporter, DHA1 family, multidrug resistance protein
MERLPIAVLSAAFLFNLGQGVLRPSLPLYLQHVFAARYRMVTVIPTAFGAGKWIASLPTGHLLDRLGRRPLMACGLLIIAACDVASMLTSEYTVFLGLRALAGAGWAMFATVATTMVLDPRASKGRGRAVSALMMSETLGLLLGSAGGGWLYQAAGVGSPFLFEAACMLLGSAVLMRSVLPAVPLRSMAGPPAWARLGTVLRTPGVLLFGFTNAALVAVQTGLLVFLLPLYLVNRADATPRTLGMIISLGVLGRLVALSWGGGGMSDRADRTRLLGFGLLANGVLIAAVILLTHPIALGLWSLAIGGVAGLVAPQPTALIGDQVPPDLHGVAIGWLRTITDTGQILGPLAMGALADAMDLSTPFVVGAMLLIATAGPYRHQTGTRPTSVTP